MTVKLTREQLIDGKINFLMSRPYPLAAHQRKRLEQLLREWRELKEAKHDQSP